MNLFHMIGGWGPVTGWVCEQVVGAGIGELYNRFVNEAAPFVPDGATIIDVGCGQGQITGRLAARFPRCQVIGLDLSPAMVERAAENNLTPDNLSFRQGDAMALPLEDASVDLAVSVASIKHWPDRLRGVQELVRVLRPGGPLCVLEVDRDCSFAAARRFTESWRHVVPRDEYLQAFYFRRFVAGQALNLDELVGVFTRAGVEDLQAQRYMDLPFVVAQAKSPS